MRIGVINKYGFITGTAYKPPAEDKAVETWLIDNSRVKSWLIDSMSPTLMQRFIRLKQQRRFEMLSQKLFMMDLMKLNYLS